MMKSSTLVTVCILASVFFVQYVRGIDWDENNSSMGCDFPGNDIKSVDIPSEECSETCTKTTGCTHFAWNPWTGGTCWLKRGTADKNNAQVHEDKTVMCGVI